MLWHSCSYKCCAGMSFLKNKTAGLQLKPIFIEKEALVLVFSWQLSGIFNNDVLTLNKLWQKALL